MKLIPLIIIFSISFYISESKILNGVFHTTEEIFSKIDQLAQGSCSNILRKFVAHSSENEKNTLIYYSIKKHSKRNNNEKQRKQKVYILFGEHSRELISPELALFFIQTLCGEVKGYSKHTINQILNQNKFLIFPIVNVPGRLRVEDGEYCKRTNENGVDLNRNWDNHFKTDKSKKGSDVYAGKKAFSEWQTRILRDVIEDYNPDIFFSIHSGALGLYSPPAYKIVNIKRLGKDVQSLVHILNIVNKKYCHCDAGPAANALDYVCPGNCMDYAHENVNVRYSFAFEIFTNPKHNKFFKSILDQENPEYFNYKKFLSSYKKNNIQERFRNNKKKHHLRHRKDDFEMVQIDQYDNQQANNDHKHSHIHSMDGNRQFSCFAETSGSFKNNDKDNKFCLDQFGPKSIKHRKNTVINWTNVLFEINSIIYQKDSDNSK